jgi:hypothetical protein
MTTQSLELLLAIVAFYSLGFLWVVLPEPEFESLEDR